MGNPINSISGFNSYTPTPQTQTPAASLQPTPTPSQPVAAPPQDTVTVSIEARARLLNTLGQSVNEIATNLEVTPKDVESYLGTTQLEAEIAALESK